MIIRFLFLVCICLSTPNNAAYSQPIGGKPADSTELTSVVVQIGIRGSKELREYTYVVDSLKKELRSQSSRELSAEQSTEWQKSLANKKHHDAQAYAAIAGRFRSEQDTNSLNKDLAAALHRIEQRSAAGYSRADTIFASSDGAYAVHAKNDEPLLLINVSTLQTRRLADNAGAPRTPIAWSPNSSALAFSLPRSGRVQVYDVKREKIITEISGNWQWLENLTWSPDGQQIGALGTENRTLNKSPLGRLAAAAGHPEFRNDVVLHVYSAAGDKQFSVPLMSGQSEWGSLASSIQWK